MTGPAYQVARAGPIEALSIQHSNWQSGSPSGEAVMVVPFSAPFGGGGRMAARSVNCTQLHGMATKFLIPSIV